MLRAWLQDSQTAKYPDSHSARLSDRHAAKKPYRQTAIHPDIQALLIGSHILDDIYKILARKYWTFAGSQ